MIEVALLGLAYLGGADPWRLTLLALAVVAPIAVLPLIVIGSVRTRRSHDDRPALFCDAVASELRAGSSLAAALESAAASIGLGDLEPRFSGSQSPLAVAEAAGREFGEIGAELKATADAAARAGGRAADLFDELAALAIAQSEIAHEVRVSSAPAVATAWVFVLAPTAFVSFQTGSGGLDRLVQAPEQRIAALVGIVLFLLGLAWVTALLWRAR